MTKLKERTRIPYGYRMVDGQMRPEPEETQKLGKLYEYYIQGYSLKNCLAMAGVERSIGWFRSVFDRTIYLGDERYPQLISREMWEKAALEAKRRGTSAVGVKKKKLRQYPVPVETEFSFDRKAVKTMPEDPVESAALLYRSIRLRGKNSDTKDKYKS